MKLFKEHFTGTYNGVVPTSYLAEGDISDGKNVQKAAEGGGWEQRRGATQLNTQQAESGAEVVSIHEYLNPKQGDYHLLTQINGKLLNADSEEFDLLSESGDTLLTEAGDTLRGSGGGDPLTERESLGTTLGVSVGAYPGYSCIVGEDLIYADGSGPPIIWGGDTPFCEAFIVWDNSEAAYVDYTDRVIDGRLDTYAVLGNAASDKYYVITKQIASAIHLKFGSTLNTLGVTPTVKGWRSGSWVDTGATDGTVGTQTHDTDGSLTWTAGAETVRVLNGVMGYCYEISFSGATSAVEIVSCQVSRAAAAITNKWDGVFSFVDGCLLYDGAEYNDALGKVSSESTSLYLELDSAGTGYYLYIKTLEPATGFGFATVYGHVNAADAQIDEIAPWTGNAWTAVTTNIVDESLDVAGDSSFAKTGTVWFDAATVSPVAQKRTFQGDPIPGYWYRLSWDGSLGADVQLYSIVYAAYPESLPTYEGCFEFFGTLFLWGDPEYPNRLRYSPFDRPDIFNGEASGYTNPVGDASKIKECIQLYDYAIIFKETGVYAMDTDLNIRKVASLVGLGSKHTAHTVEVGIKGMTQDELVSVCIWQELDGVYMYDAAKPKKVSGPIDQYFNPDYDDCISEEDIRSLRAYINPIRNTYHLLTSTVELVYNYKTDEWYPPWERYVPLTCGKSIKGESGRYKLVGGTAEGFLNFLNSGLTDIDSAGVAHPVEHYVTTRAIAVMPENSMTLEFSLAKCWAEVSGRSTGTVEVSLYINEELAAQSTVITKSLVSTTREIIRLGLEYSKTRVTSFRLKFACNSSTSKLEFWSLLYTLEGEGIPNIT